MTRWLTEDEQRSWRAWLAASLLLPLAVRVRLATLWQVAAKVASDNGFTMDLIHDALMTLLQARIPLVTNDDQLKRAVAAVQRLMTTTIAGAQQRGFHTLPEFFLNEALFKMPRVFPLTD